MTSSNKSLSLLFSIEPSIGVYYFISEHLAPYANCGVKFMYTRNVTHTDGTSYVYTSDYSLFDDLLMKVEFSIGLKYFLPPGERFGSRKQPTVGDFITEIGF